jgi:glycerol-3-phosphate acyltransferase PlsY
LRFRGGKGIATLLGVGLAATPVIALGGFGIFLVVLGVTRYVSFASMVAVAGGVALGWFVPGEAHELVPIYFVLLAFVIYLHRKNIRRLLSGEEPKFPGSLPRK